jgi:hypothetical protein
MPTQMVRELRKMFKVLNYPYQNRKLIVIGPVSYFAFTVKSKTDSGLK